MPESWEAKLNEFYKLLEDHEKTAKKGAVLDEPFDAPKPEPIEKAAETEKPTVAKPWPPPIPGLSKPEPTKAQVKKEASPTPSVKPSAKATPTTKPTPTPTP